MGGFENNDKLRETSIQYQLAVVLKSFKGCM